MGKVLVPLGTGNVDHILFAVPKLQVIKSDKDNHFTESLAKNGVERENLTGMLTDRVRITKVSITSRAALRFRISFFAKDTFDNSDQDQDFFIASVEADLVKYGVTT